MTQIFEVLNSPIVSNIISDLFVAGIIGIVGLINNKNDRHRQ